MNFIFGMQINTKVSYKSIISLAYLGMLNENVKGKVDFLSAAKIKSFFKLML